MKLSKNQLPIIEQSPATIPTDWCDDADAWNSDDDGGDEENKKQQQPSSVPKTVKKRSGSGDVRFDED